MPENVPKDGHPVYHNNLDACLWLDTSAEMAALYHQGFALARARVTESIRVYLELKARGDTPKPLCVVSDLDETLLDNSPYNAWLMLAGHNFHETGSWNRYCRAKISRATPGARAFVLWLADRSAQTGVPVRLFYVTSRMDAIAGKDAGVRKETVENLEKLGLSPEQVHPWSTDGRLFMAGTLIDDVPTKKHQQVAHIEHTLGHTIAALLGDSLSDHDALRYARSVAHADRYARAEEDASEWGGRWIVFPNPVYGGWRDSLYKKVQGDTPDDQASLVKDDAPVRQALVDAPKTAFLDTWAG